VQLHAESNQRHCGSSADPPTRPSTHSSWGLPPLFCDLSGAFATLHESNQRHCGSPADPPADPQQTPAGVATSILSHHLSGAFERCTLSLTRGPTAAQRIPQSDLKHAPNASPHVKARAVLRLTHIIDCYLGYAAAIWGMLCSLPPETHLPLPNHF
jgi:hypothetical protein